MRFEIKCAHPQTKRAVYLSGDFCKECGATIGKDGKPHYSPSIGYIDIPDELLNGRGIDQAKHKEAGRGDI